MSSTQILTKAKMLTAKGDFEKAEQLILSVLSRFPKNKTAKQHLINLASKRAHKFGHVIKIQTEQLTNLAEMFEQENYEAVVEMAERLQLLYPEKFIIWFMSGVAKRYLEDFNGAFANFEQALILDPSHSELHLEIGIAFEAAGDNKNAFKSYHRCKLLNDLDPRPHNYIGIMYQKAQKYETALENFEFAIKTGPKSPDGYNNAALVCNELLEFSQSLVYVEQAIKLDPLNPNFYFNRAFIEGLNGNPESGLKMHGHAIERAEAAGMEDIIIKFSFNEAILSLTLGKIKEGWKAYAKRFDSLNFPSKYRDFVKPRLQNLEQARGKRILIWCEQGLGDEFMFMNLAIHFQKITNCKYLIEGSVRLKSLMSRSFKEADVRDVVLDHENEDILTTASESDYDYHMPYGDFPCLLNLHENDEHMIEPYLKADTKLIKKWKNILPSGKIKIGFSWRSQLNYGMRKLNYTELEIWQDLITDDRYSFVNLQYGDISDDIDRAPKEIQEHLFMPEIDLKNDLENLAAIIANCDVVIAPGNAVMQQAAALGIKTISHLSTHSYTYLGREEKPLHPSRHPFLKNNYSILFPRTQSIKDLPILVKKQLTKLGY